MIWPNIFSLILLYKFQLSYDYLPNVKYHHLTTDTIRFATNYRLYESLMAILLYGCEMWALLANMDLRRRAWEGCSDVLGLSRSLYLTLPSLISSPIPSLPSSYISLLVLVLLDSSPLPSYPPSVTRCDLTIPVSSSHFGCWDEGRFASSLPYTTVWQLFAPTAVSATYRHGTVTLRYRVADISCPG